MSVLYISNCIIQGLFEFSGLEYMTNICYYCMISKTVLIVLQLPKALNPPTDRFGHAIYDIKFNIVY